MYGRVMSCDAGISDNNIEFTVPGLFRGLFDKFLDIGRGLYVAFVRLYEDTLSRF